MQLAARTQAKEDERCPKGQSEELLVSHRCASDMPAERVP